MVSWFAPEPAEAVRYWLRAGPKAVSAWLFKQLFAVNQRFGKRYRLLKTEEFSSVFALRKCRSGVFLQIFYSGGNEAGHARLGLVVGKKAAKRANVRNYMKRIIREWFRCHKSGLASADFVVRVRRRFDTADADAVRKELAVLFRYGK